jgi:hypothetical protein
MGPNDVLAMSSLPPVVPQWHVVVIVLRWHVLPVEIYPKNNDVKHVSIIEITIGEKNSLLWPQTTSIVVWATSSPPVIREV